MPLPDRPHCTLSVRVSSARSAALYNSDVGLPWVNTAWASRAVHRHRAVAQSRRCSCRPWSAPRCAAVRDEPEPSKRRWVAMIAIGARGRPSKSWPRISCWPGPWAPFCTPHQRIAQTWWTLIALQYVYCTEAVSWRPMTPGTSTGWPRLCPPSGSPLGAQAANRPDQAASKRPVGVTRLNIGSSSVRKPCPERIAGSSSRSRSAAAWSSARMMAMP